MPSREKAPQACRPCRRLKRRCTRELPACSLCIRLGKACGYPMKAQEDHSNDPDFLLQRIQQLEYERDHRPQPQTERSIGLASPLTGIPLTEGIFPSPATVERVQMFAELFLDPETFKTPTPSALDPGSHIPKPILEILEEPYERECIRDRYFNTVHQWLPMISAKRLAQRVPNFYAKPDITLALLLSCMKLVTYPLVYDLRHTPLYYTAKQFFQVVQDSCMMSIHLLQATVLIALYEIAHGAYPVGYLSVCHAVRLGMMMGLHDRKHAAQLFGPSDTWTLREEERRTWWAVVVLDRYVHSGTTGLPLAAPEPPQNDLLPCDDSSWDQGDIGTNEPVFALNTTVNTRYSKFASICRASHILGRVLRHRDERDRGQSLDLSFQLSEAAQLHRALLALETSFDQAVNRDSSIVPRALVYTARMVLYTLYACNDAYTARYGGVSVRLGEETDMQRVSQDGLREVTGSVHGLALELQRAIAMNIDAVSPLVVHCIFMALGEAAWHVREGVGGDESMSTALDTMLDVLEALNKRWKICG